MGDVLPSIRWMAPLTPQDGVDDFQMSRWDSGAGIMQSRNQILGAPNRDLEINLTPSQTSTDTVNLTPSQTNTQSN